MGKIAQQNSDNGESKVNIAGNPRKLDSQSEDKVYEEIKKYDKNIKVTLIFVVICALCFIFSFIYKQTLFDLSASIDYNLFGTFGDFIGGVIGTFIATYVMILVLRTLQNQLEYSVKTHNLNKKLLSATKVSNELLQKQDIQIFDSQFHTFFNLYKSSIDDYTLETKITGRDALKELTQKFLQTPFKSNLTYRKRVSSACEIYEGFYASCSDKMSTHFRMLYQLVSLISNANYIDDRIKVNYAKAVRANLTKSEMILLRYNCYCPQGQKMQQYVNEYNLLKHLPLMQLFEFRQWADLLNSSSNLEQALEVMFVVLRKKICKVIEIYDDENIRRESLICGKKWIIKISYKQSEYSLFVKIINNNIVSKEEGLESNIEKAFDRLGVDNLERLFYDYFVELFFISNFRVYNKRLKIMRHFYGGNKNQIFFSFQSNYPITLSQPRPTQDKSVKDAS